MRKALTAALAAVTFGGAVAATALPAQAQSRYYQQRDYRHHRGNNNDAGVAIAAGVVGLALGAAIAGSNRNSRGYYSQGYYDRSYGYDRGYGYNRGYAPAYAYEPGYRVCESRQRVYDPYLGRRVVVRERYAC
jgi:hypothetical protein